MSKRTEWPLTFVAGDKVRVARVVIEHDKFDRDRLAQVEEGRAKAEYLMHYLGAEGEVTYAYHGPAAGYYTVGFGPSLPHENLCDFTAAELELA